MPSAGEAAKRTFCPLLWAKLVLRRGVFLVIWLCSLSTTFLKQNTPQAPPAATLLVTPSNLGARGGAPAFFFSIFLLMPKEIWPGLGWKPSSRQQTPPKKHKWGLGLKAPKRAQVRAAQARWYKFGFAKLVPFGVIPLPCGLPQWKAPPGFSPPQRKGTGSSAHWRFVLSGRQSPRGCFPFPA